MDNGILGQLKAGRTMYETNPARNTQPHLVMLEIDRLSHRGHISGTEAGFARVLADKYANFFRDMKVLDAADLAVEIAKLRIARITPALLRRQAE